jgi:hypothetical protein
VVPQLPLGAVCFTDSRWRADEYESAYAGKISKSDVEMPAWSANLGNRLVKTPKITLNDTRLPAVLLGIKSDNLHFLPISYLWRSHNPA